VGRRDTAPLFQEPAQREDPTRRSRLRSRSLLLLVGIAWVAAVALGSAMMLNYEFSPGAPGTPSPSWPADLASLGGQRVSSAGRADVMGGLHPDRRSAHLVMVAHPRCPCTRASIAELAQILARARGSVAATVLFYRPPQFSPGWERTDLWRSAAAIPGVTVLADPDGREAQRLGAVTSGHVLLYDRAGQLLFTGGITGARGHEGDNVGCESVIRLIAGRGGARHHMLIYGCSIRASQVASGQ
jgi:hypothetical protein